MDKDNADVAFELFGKIVTQSSHFALKTYAKRDDVVLEELNRDPTDAEQNQIHSRILMTSGSNSIALVHFFTLETAVALAERLIKDDSPLDRETQALDFMREFSNLHGGVVRAMAHKLDMKISASLPMVISTHQSLIKSSMANPKRTVWKLKAGEATVVGAATVVGFASLAENVYIARMRQILRDEIKLAGECSVEMFYEGE
jgi:CheY-specific phosphatase CheX